MMDTRTVYIGTQGLLRFTPRKEIQGVPSRLKCTEVGRLLKSMELMSHQDIVLDDFIDTPSASLERVDWEIICDSLLDYLKRTKTRWGIYTRKTHNGHAWRYVVDVPIEVTEEELFALICKTGLVEDEGEFQIYQADKILYQADLISYTSLLQTQ